MFKGDLNGLRLLIHTKSMDKNNVLYVPHGKHQCFERSRLGCDLVLVNKTVVV